MQSRDWRQFEEWRQYRCKWWRGCVSRCVCLCDLGCIGSICDFRAWRKSSHTQTTLSQTQRDLTPITVAWKSLQHQKEEAREPFSSILLNIEARTATGLFQPKHWQRLLIRAQCVASFVVIVKLLSPLLYPNRTRCQRWSVSCRLALRTLWSVCAPTPVVSQTVLTASMCLPSCSTSGCLRWCAWSVMDTLYACPSQASSAGQCQNMLHN